jgi:hypothetical protein
MGPLGDLHVINANPAKTRTGSQTQACLSVIWTQVPQTHTHVQLLTQMLRQLLTQQLTQYALCDSNQTFGYARIVLLRPKRGAVVDQWAKTAAPAAAAAAAAVAAAAAAAASIVA